MMQVKNVKLSGEVPLGRLHEEGAPIAWQIRFILWFKPLRWYGMCEGDSNCTVCVGYKQFAGVIYILKKRPWFHG